MSNSKWPPGQIQLAIILSVSLIYVTALFCGVQVAKNAKLLLTLTNKKRPPDFVIEVASS